MGTMGMDMSGMDQQRGMPMRAVRQGGVFHGKVMPPAGRRPAQYAAKKGRSGKFRVTRTGA